MPRPGDAVECSADRARGRPCPAGLVRAAHDPAWLRPAFRPGGPFGLLCPLHDEGAVPESLFRPRTTYAVRVVTRAGVVVDPPPEQREGHRSLLQEWAAANGLRRLDAVVELVLSGAVVQRPDAVFYRGPAGVSLDETVRAARVIAQLTDPPDALAAGLPSGGARRLRWRL